MKGYSSARLIAAVPSPSSGGTAAKAGGAGKVLPLNLGGGGAGSSERRTGQEQQALVYVPAGYRPGVPAPFVLTLHGAGGDAHGEGWRRGGRSAGIDACRHQPAAQPIPAPPHSRPTICYHPLQAA